MTCPKTSFATEATAKRRLRSLWGQARHNGKMPVRAYCCPWCHRWHLTSQTEHEKNGRAFYEYWNDPTIERIDHEEDDCEV